MSSIRSVLIFLTLFALSFPTLGQQDPKELARQYYEQVELILSETKAMEIALEQLVTAADLDTTFLKANYEAGHMHLITINKHLATKYFLRVLRQDPNYRFDLEYWIGKGYQYGFEFSKAIQYYNLYKDKLAKRSSYQGKDKIDLPTVDRSIFECESGLEFVSNPMNFSIVNIGREINSEYEDYAPVLNENEDEIVFTTRRRDGNMNENVYDDNKPWEDIFIARKVGNSWEVAKNIGSPVNTPYHNSNSALSADGRMLFVFTDEGNGDLYFTRLLEDGKWSEPEPLPGIINSTFEEKSITLSKDEMTLYFSSNRPGGFGGLDIYRATKDEKGNWSNVRNLGPKVNTDLDEDGPFIDYDGVTLYFSSKGKKGMGGFDVFKATYDPDGAEWSDPVNLGYPINTPDDDIYFVTSKDSKRAYYSSVREDGMGYTDIYMITIPEGLKNIQPTDVVKAPVDTATTVVTNNNNTVPDGQTNTVPDPPKDEIIPLRYVVTVVDAGDDSPMDAKVNLVGAQDNVIVGMSPVGGGKYEFSITSKSTKEYRLSVEKEGYAFQNLLVRIGGASTQDKTINRTIELRKLAENVTGVLRNIYFDFDKATFKTASYNELNKLEAMLRQNETLTVEIGGHTDAVGTKDYNLYLSRRRAEAVKDFLTKKGIDARRVKAVGYGKSKPLVSNDDEHDGREINRRVEFKVLSK
jgi:outer membrane protein OmpA-like peptidoglycan-associated protein